MLGLEPTVNSGSGWIQKEDGESEDIICQLKSTDANSIKINKKDIDTLIYHSLVSHKVPVFAINFLSTGEVFLIIRPDDLYDISELMKGNKPVNNKDIVIDVSDESKKKNKVIKSSHNSRKAFMKQNDEKYMKRSKSAL